MQSKISKEKAIVLTSYERRSLIRFLAIYLGSVFVLLAIIGYLFFENSRVSMLNAIKFEMLYQARSIDSTITMRAMQHGDFSTRKATIEYLRKLKHCRFDVGYFDAKGRPIYAEFDPPRLDEEFFIDASHQCYAVNRDPSAHLGVAYVVLREHELAKSLQALRLKIIGYLLVSFLLMGAVGYVLGRLFLQPVREHIEALDRFIADTTHELNTPVSAILMTLSTLKEIDETKRKRLEASAKRLSLTYGALTYKLEGNEEKSEALRLDTIVRERVEFMRPLAEVKDLHLTLACEPTTVCLPKSAAERLVDNLLSNAIKYTDRGDSVTVTLQEGTLCIADTGIGMDEAEQREIFKRYRRANKERGGFGIGLSIVADICKRYGIALDVTSVKGDGSAFALRFPRCPS